MSSSNSGVCEGSHSCLLEQRVMMMKLAPPMEIGSKIDPETIHDHSDMKQDKTIGDNGGWSLLQSLYDNTHKPETEKVYVHPTEKERFSFSLNAQFSFSLNAKSLEMCTERLGCETGTDSDDVALFSLESSTKQSEQSPTSESHRNRVSKRASKCRSASNFPPPLSSMRERGGVQVRPRREDGRLILEAVPAVSPLPYFTAERGNGRLTLRLMNTFHSSYEGDDGAIKEEEEVDDDEAEEEEVDENYENVEDETGMRNDPGPSWCNQVGDSSTQILHLMGMIKCDG